MTDPSDQQLLRDAAKAAGIQLYSDAAFVGLGGGRPRLYTDLRGHIVWNPLGDDGDALRLAVKLNLTIKFVCDPDGPMVMCGAPWHDKFPDYYWSEWLHKDSSAATRRAIVRAAAAIGAAK